MLSDREILSPTWLLLVGVVFLLCTQITNAHCSRPLSRIVRSQLKENFYSVFEAKNVAPHSACPLLNSMDLYSVQEENKFQEHGAKWVCNFCGKAFYSEYYLDRHFENRHVDMLVKGTTVCLADFCDIFRCDFFEDQRKDRFWEKKLCKEERLTVRRKRCEALVRSCLPRSNLSVDEEFEIYDTIRENTCLLLNCKDYWKPLYEEVSPWKVVFYAVVTPFFFIGVIVYYYALWEHYYDDYPFESRITTEVDESFPVQRKHERTTDSMRKRYHRRDIVMY